MGATLYVLGASADHATELVCAMADMLSRGMPLPLRINHAFTNLIPNDPRLSSLDVDVQAQGFQACWFQLLKVKYTCLFLFVHVVRVRFEVIIFD